jgi:hypothetical protein
MARKLVLTAALLFSLSVAFLSRPALAAPLCDCDLCTFSPNSQCIDDWGFRTICSTYAYFNC